MGTTLSRKVGRYWTRKDRRVLLVGLDSAGKTTILYHLRLHKAIPTLPTLGFNTEALSFHGLTLNLWDVGGQDTLRPYWRHHFTGTQGIVFVIDSSDHERVDLAKAELHGVLHDDQLRDACLLVLMNKQDLAKGDVDVVKELALEEVCQSRKYLVQPTVATTGAGLEQGFMWLCEHMNWLFLNMPDPGTKAQQPRHKNGQRKKQSHAQRVGREIAQVLGERKIHLVVRVVALIGERLARSVLTETLSMQKQGSTLKTVTGRSRTLGGAFFTLLKERVTKETYKDIYALEDQKKKEMKKSKVRAARIKTENALMGGFSTQLHLHDDSKDAEDGEVADVREENPRFIERDSDHDMDEP
ncbi:hypothetical protein B5M09_006361 [Aphanomyces astaci]|uniref:Phosphorylated adapter RNA export protein RNA-binding domain-containing protein n=1 Tax=Aphanomyces astaci TaxID=112090 RepID=A0A3R7YF95_APHAT|nr:hypothetical protein B5M09_006361 [Aphanomyces astaci]